MARPRKQYPVTPDGRYFVVRGQLWRSSNPTLPEVERTALVKNLMAARRTRDRAATDMAKRALGERGPVWWTDGAPDLNRHMARNTLYAEWYAALGADCFPGPPLRSSQRRSKMRL